MEPVTNPKLDPPIKASLQDQWKNDLISVLEGAKDSVHREKEGVHSLYAKEDSAKLFSSVNYYGRDYIIKKLVRKLLSNDKKFVISFSGTSVTAGHDNLFKESYPIVFGDLITKAYQDAGLEVVARNHGMGNNPPIPAFLCVGAQLGEDTDVASWEFGMMTAGQERYPLTELWIRNALSLPNQPAIMLLDAMEGARKPQDGKLPTDPRQGDPVPYARDFMGPNANLIDLYGKFGLHTQAQYQAVWSLDTKPEFNFNMLVKL